jgi:hypothetical protein
MTVRVRRVAVAVLSVVAAGARSPRAQAPRVTFSDTRLKNGLRVIISEDHSAPVYSIAVTYNVGSRDERPGRTGFAHLFEHMMFKGSEQVGPGEHFTLVFNNGGDMNGTTNKDRTLYYETLPSNQLDLGCSSRRTGCGRSKSPKKTSTTSGMRCRKSAAWAWTTSPTAALLKHRPAGLRESGVQTLGHRLDGRSERRDGRGRLRVLQDVLRAEQRGAGDCRRREDAECLEKVRKYFDRIPSQPAPTPVGHERAAADSGATTDD